jgi:hypothetical protein
VSGKLIEWLSILIARLQQPLLIRTITEMDDHDSAI